MLTFSSCIVICLVSIGFEDVFAETVEFPFHNHGIVPDVVKTAPRIMLYVKYPKGAEANFGNELTPAQASSTPTVLWEADPGSLFTLVMLDADAYPDQIQVGNVSLVLWLPSKETEDTSPWLIEHPDAPSRKHPARRHWLHWLVGNIPGRALGKGTTMADYNGPNPPKGTGAHRYVFLIYKQTEKLNFTEQFPAAEKAKRSNFNLEKFTDKYNLGDPIAGNFFQALPHEH